MALKNRRTQNRRRQQNKKRKSLRKNTRKNLKKKRQSRRRMRGGGGGLIKPNKKEILKYLNAEIIEIIQDKNISISRKTLVDIKDSINTDVNINAEIDNIVGMGNTLIDESADPRTISFNIKNRTSSLAYQILRYFGYNV